MIKLLIGIMALSLVSCSTAMADQSSLPDFEKLASAIRKAEGNPNYGILAHYRHTSYRQACINTCRHKYRQWLANSENKPYLAYLASKYAPIGANNDPMGLNRNWLGNVEREYYGR